MSLLHSLLLGALQGITEFLPISSDGHLVLLESMLGLKTENLKGFDVILHLGTLVAMVVYFWKDILRVLQKPKLIGYIVVASFPVVIAGLTLEDWMDGQFRNPKATLLFMMVLAVFFLIAEKWPQKKEKATWALRNTFLMGLAQATALLPGISRSGSVMGTGLLCGIKREEAARFSFLLGMPAIAGAIGLKSLHILWGKTPLPETDAMVLGLVTSTVVGYASVAFLMKFLKTHSLRVFSVYLFGVGMVGLILI